MTVVTFTKHVQYDKHRDKYLHIFIPTILFQKPLIQVLKFQFYRIGPSVKRLLVSSFIGKLIQLTYTIRIDYFP